MKDKIAEGNKKTTKSGRGEECVQDERRVNTTRATPDSNFAVGKKAQRKGRRILFGPIDRILISYKFA